MVVARPATLLLLCGAVAWSAQVKADTTAWAPIRITPVYNSSVSRYPSDIQKLIKNVLLPAVISWFSEVVRVRKWAESNMLLMRDCSSGVQFIKEQRMYCQESCAQATMCGPVLIPDSHLQPCSSCDWSGLNCVTDRTQHPGVNNTDFILYVSALDDQCNDLYAGQVAYGGHCQQESVYNRPIAGYLNFCPALLVDGSSFDHKIGLTLHELVHTLVFSKLLLSYYRDEQGLPRTQRSWTGDPLTVNGNYIIGTSTLTYIKGPFWSPLNSDFVGVIVTPKVVRAAIEHFNCSTLIGAQLQDVQGQDLHWDKRLFGDEVMTGSLYDYYIVSKITLALFEDSGWYQVDYRYAQPLDWGRSRGCGFVNSSCAGWLSYAPDPYPFCAVSDWSGGHHKCVNSLKAVGDCAIVNYSVPLNQYQVLPPNLGGTDSLADFCPMYQAYDKAGKKCNILPSKTQASNPGLEAYGPSSMCLTLSKPWTTVNSRGAMATQADWGAGCYQITCTPSQVMVLIGSQTLQCQPGVTKEVSVMVAGVRHIGGVVCPAYNDVCGGYNCYKKCSGAGECSNGYCLCHPGYFGDDCSRRYLEGLSSCSVLTCRHGAQCQDTPLGGRCACPPRFTGALCEDVMVVDPCAVQPCGGRGLCYRSNGGLAAVCHCYLGYSGAKCQDLVDFCKGRCVHGQCTNDSTSPSCSCLPGYSGPNCSELTNPCALKPCKNGGLCTNLNSSQHLCRCPIGFKGKICKLLDTPCPPNACPNGSTCYIAGTNHSVCACMDGSCDQMWAGLCPSTLCQNGGRCVWNGVATQCLCPPGASGESCMGNTTAIPSFLGNGHMIVPMAMDNTTNGYFTITISLRPAGAGGLVFYWEGLTTVVSLGLQGLSLVYRIGSKDGGDQVEVRDNTSLLLGSWYSVTMEWTAASCALHVTGEKARTRTIPCPGGRAATPLTLGYHAFLGGHGNISASMVEGYGTGFVGCISHMEVNGSPVDMAGGEVWHVFQCGTAGPCARCGGVCRSSPVEGYWCECRPSRGGVKCDQALPSSPSFNHSYLLVPIATQPLTNISITFTPHTSSGLLLLFTTTPTAADNYMSISLNTTNIVVETHLVSGVGWQVAVPYTLGAPQGVVMVFKKGALKSINSYTVGGAPLLQGSPLLVYVGGIPPWQQTQWGWWSGCVQNVAVNGQVVSLTSTITSSNVLPCSP